MPKVEDISGNVVAELTYTDEGMEQAKSIADSSPTLNVEYAPGGSFDAMSRMEQNYAGSGKTGFNKIGMIKPIGGNSPLKKEY